MANATRKIWWGVNHMGLLEWYADTDKAGGAEQGSSPVGLRLQLIRRSWSHGDVEPFDMKYCTSLLYSVQRHDTMRFPLTIGHMSLVLETPYIL